MCHINKANWEIAFFVDVVVGFSSLKFSLYLPQLLRGYSFDGVNVRRFGETRVELRAHCIVWMIPEYLSVVIFKEDKIFMLGERNILFIYIPVSYFVFFSNTVIY